MRSSVRSRMKARTTPKNNPKSKPIAMSSACFGLEGAAGGVAGRIDLTGVGPRGDARELTLEDRDAPVDGVTFRLGVLVLGRPGERAVETLVELVPPHFEIVDLGTDLRSLRDRGCRGTLGLVLQIRLGERVGTRSSIAALAVGEEDVQHEGVGSHLHTHPLQELRDGQDPTPAIPWRSSRRARIRTRRASVSRLTS